MDQPMERFHYENVTVDPQNFSVTRDGQQVVLTPRAFDVLLVLVKNAGRIVEKQEIFESVWKDTFVTDNALAKIVKELRAALGDVADNPHLIETVPKRGYRFIANVTRDMDSATSQPAQQFGRHPVEAPVPAHKVLVNRRDLILLSIAAILVALMAGWVLYRQTTKASPQPIRTIAVLPFKPLSDDSRDESLEMGMAETLINRLSVLKQLAVRPITAVRKFTDPSQDPVKAGEETQTEAVLDGNIQKSGDRIRVTVRLIDVAKGTPLWTEKFDERFTDIFRVQDSIAERVTNALVIELSRQEKERLGRHETSDPVAYEEYLECQLLWHGRRENWIEQSKQCYENVISKDPGFALAYVGAAESYMMLNGHLKLSRTEAANKARPLIAKALEIDGSLALAHNALAELKYQYDFDWAGAESEFKKALELNPNVPWIRQANGWFLMTQGRFDEAAAEMDLAKSLDPSSVTIDVGRGRLYYFMRDYEKARLHFEKLIELEPDDTSLRYSLFTILEQQHKYKEAVEDILKVFERNGAPPAVLEELREAFQQHGWQGFLEKQLEVQAKRPRKEPPAPWFYANHYTRMGQKDEAFKWLEKSFDIGEIGNLQLKIDPLYDGLRDDPRYARLLARIGLTP
jgi:DNA-binding winged helix-turn-helix (wHTH) protein/TolB-like protein/tetratricopeptide (TPR) repeat protein